MTTPFEPFAREQVVAAFVAILQQHRPRLFEDPVDVAVLGGYPTEPELLTLPHVRNVTTLGIGPEADISLDLDAPLADYRSSYDDHFRSYDLVLMSQVLEHLMYPANAFMHVEHLLRRGGVAWIACPHANFPHGGTRFFSSGYSTHALGAWASAAGLDEIESGNWGSAREAETRMVASMWLEDSYYWPRKHLKVLTRRKTWREIARVIRRAPVAYLRSPHPSSRHPMETFGLFGKP